ncbi:hypothetical protein ACLKA6_006178 [Drosophila palustris]
MEYVVEPPQSSINLRAFLEEYKTKLNCLESVPFYFDRSSPVAADVEASCSLELLSSPDDNAITVFEPSADKQRHNVTQPDMNRHVPKTYKILTEKKSKSRRNPFTKTQYSYRQIAEPTINGNKNENFLLDDFELQITVRFYRPPRAAHRWYKLESPVFAEEFVCLGSNYLTELRDKISCICKGKRFVDISEDPEAPLPVLQTDPGYFFINGTFYNDTRNPNNCDYSQTVLKWASSAQGLQREHFDVASMEATRFIDLTVGLGTPLQYLHHGNCEHLFVISQVEVLRPHSKYLNRSLYPILRAVNCYNRRSCYMCGQRVYHYIVEQSRRQLHDPSYLCRSCFYSFHYVDGQKVGQFKAYRIYEHTDNSAGHQDKEDFDDSSDGSSELE